MAISQSIYNTDTRDEAVGYAKGLENDGVTAEMILSAYTRTERDALFTYLKTFQTEGITAAELEAKVDEAPQDGQEYVRKDAAWLVLTHPTPVLPTMTDTSTSNTDGLDVSSLAPNGILYIDSSSNKEIKSLSGGVDNQILRCVNLQDVDIKFKHQNGAAQELRLEGAVDRTIGDYGGYHLVCKDGYWYGVNGA